MSISNEEIVGSCLHLLRDINRHPHGRNERVFITAYQIWILLEEQNHSICERLIRYGPAVGKDAGNNIGPAQRIAQALGRSRRIETRYLDTRCIHFDNFYAPGADCGLFRINE